MHSSLPSSRQRIASLIAARMACEVSGAGIVPSVAGEQLRGLEALELMEGRRFDQAQFDRHG